MGAYQELEGRFEELAALGHAFGILGWDEQTQMPEGSAPARNEAVSRLRVLAHRLITSDALGELLKQAADEQLDDWQRANLALMQRERDHALVLPAEFVQRQSQASMEAEQAWRKLRPANDWIGFLPYFETNLALVREEANLRARDLGVSPYDALLDLYEPGLTSADLDNWFGALDATLPDLIDGAAARSRGQSPLLPKGPFSIRAQEQLGRTVMGLLQFDFDRGRLDVAVHPFCGGAIGDVRITTRYREDDFQESLMGIIHETGHAQYQQNLPERWRLQPVGSATGMAVHESQSLFFEMQIGRSPEFMRTLGPLLAEAFPNEASEVWGQENLVPLYQRVRPGLIRVSADEVTYPAHILLRYEIEKELLSGDLKPADLPARWHQGMQARLGLGTEGNDKDGCMQDVHWPSGAFGYFPTYTVGAMIAAQLAARLREDLPDWSGQWQRGELGPTRDWLHERIWTQGSRRPMKALVEAATGQPLSADAYLTHLRRRYLD